MRAVPPQRAYMTEMDTGEAELLEGQGVVMHDRLLVLLLPCMAPLGSGAPHVQAPFYTPQPPPNYQSALNALLHSPTSHGPRMHLPTSPLPTLAPNPRSACPGGASWRAPSR